MATLGRMARKYADTNFMCDNNPSEVYTDGAQDILVAVLDKIKAKYGYNKPFLYTDLLDTINELLKDE